MTQSLDEAFAPPPLYGPVIPLRRPPVDGLAVASLVCSLLLLAPVGLPLGIIALVRTARTGNRGRGLAIAAISVSGVTLAVAAAFLGGALHFRVWAYGGSGVPIGTSSAPTQSANGERVHINDLHERDCFTPGELPVQDGGGLDDFSAVRLPCTEAHRGELYALVQLPHRATYPGTEWIKTAATEACTDRLFDYTPDPAVYGGLRTYFYFPERDRWQQGDRTVRCWAGLPQGELDQSVRQDTATLDPAQRAYLEALRPLQQAQAERPLKGPKRDLPGARQWAKEMSVAQAETARLLDEAQLPERVGKPAKELAAELRRGVPHWDEAAKAASSNVYYAAMQRAAVDPARGIDLERRLRTGLDLPIPDVRPGAGGSGGSDGGSDA
ncbi:DUF4190 domain-containing protein [Streptomyces mesophilus]|uniref:DUF4190 domain-containing protein n=1 Tax=Streptomyces mesophilus TaxID=1775132 RepID=UPI003330143F